MPFRRRNMRTLLAIVLLLTAGAIINIAVAWGIRWIGFGYSDDSDEAGVASAFDDQGRVIESWWVERADALGGTALISSRIRNLPQPISDFDGLEHPLEVLPEWAEFDPPTPEFVTGQEKGDMRVVELRGLPWRSLGCAMFQDFTTGAWRSTQAIDIGRPIASDIPKVLPLRPLWPGFVFNTIFYSALNWALIARGIVLRSRGRAKRGLCAGCAYPIGASDTCTECGRSVSGVKRKAETQKADTA